MKVLIIDDEEDTRSIASMSLGLIGGAEVVEACDGYEGVKKAAEEKPDVIILDLLMPGMDGTETFKTLKRNPVTEGIPVIFLTVTGMFEEFDNLRAMGALAVLTKPFDPTLLTSQITEILNAAGNKDAAKVVVKSDAPDSANHAINESVSGSSSESVVHTDNAD
jgi:CheY-like chemotaxis protein